MSKRGRIRRGAIKIIADILSIASGGVNKTRIVYGANLNAKRAKKHIRGLMAKGFMPVKEGLTGAVTPQMRIDGF